MLSWPIRRLVVESATRFSKIFRPTSETAFYSFSILSKCFKPGGRAAVVIKNTFLSTPTMRPVSLRKLLVESCNLHTVLDCPPVRFKGRCKDRRAVL